MYRILIATNEPRVLDTLNAIVDWQSLNFKEPMIVGNAEEAIEMMETKRVDSIAYMLPADEARKLSMYLASRRPSLPIFQVKRTPEGQKNMLTEVRRVLDRVHMDMSDDVYDERAVLNMLADELTHNLLVGDVETDKQLHDRLQMIRSHVAPDKPCLMYDFDLPAGEVYLSAQWRYGSERLESALRNNFFGRYYDNIYYAVAVLTPRHIRVVACQRADCESETEENLIAYTGQHVQQALDNIKEYLGLDMVLTSCHILDTLYLLTREHAA